MSELRTATETDYADDNLLSGTKVASGSGLFSFKLAKIKAYVLGLLAGATTAGYVLTANTDGLSASWKAPAGGGGSGLPNGGTAGQVLTKIDATNGNADWETPTGGGGASGAGSAGAAKAHSWWRVWFPHGYGYFAYGMATLEFRDAVGGPTLCVGGTPYGSAAPSTGNLANLFDNDPATFAAIGNSPSGQIMNIDAGFGYQFATPVKVAEVRLQSRNDGDATAATQTPQLGEIQFSDDGTEWYSAFDYRFDTAFGIGDSRLIRNPFGSLISSAIASEAGWQSLYNWNSATNAALPSGTPVIIDVSRMTDALLTFDNLTKSGSVSIDIRFSVDGGVTFDSSGNYHSDIDAHGNYQYADGAIYSNGGSAGPSLFTWIISNLRSSNSPKPYIGSRSGVYVNHAPITHIQLNIDADYTGGSLNVSGKPDKVVASDARWDFNPPKVANFPTIFQSAATRMIATDDPDVGMYLQTDQNVTTDEPRGWMKTIPHPALDWQVIMRLNAKGHPRASGTSAGYSEAGFHLCNSASAHVVTWAIDARSVVGWSYFEKPNGYGGNQTFWSWIDNENWWKVRHDATAATIIWSTSPDGKNWFDIKTSPDTDRFGALPDQIGPGFVVHKGEVRDLQMTIPYWVESGPGFAA